MPRLKARVRTDFFVALHRARAVSCDRAPGCSALSAAA